LLWVCLRWVCLLWVCLRWGAGAVGDWDDADLRPVSRGSGEACCF
jgi:hypothetical protein